MRSLDTLSVDAREEGPQSGDRKRRRSWLSLLLNWLPLVLVSALFVWAYYAYVLVFCGSVLQDSVFKAAFFGVGFHLLLFLCLWCIPKMDHHCPWFNNCVCFSTYKFFLLTLFYAVALSLFGVATTGKYVVERAVALGLGAFLRHHVTMVLSNETTLENMRAPLFRTPGDSFDIGSYQNFVEVFGPRASLWMLPLFTSTGDGVRFPTKLHPIPEELESQPLSVETSGSNGTLVCSPSATTVAVIP
ncbi:hypothetical protein V5799_011020 [Amblyomma americanum]|uniref:Palmitoyltransferase n=1 Tax=Amblyomma americanum TaxID=6943 RepID=A0AAQ4EI18_AMBAM